MRKLFAYSFSLVAVLIVLLALLLSASVYTFHALTGETVIAELTFEPMGERAYLAHLRTGDRCEERVLPVFGDQWRIDAEFLKWKYWALLLGLDSQYRLDRLEGRYRASAEQNSRPNVAHDLGARTAIDVTALADALGKWNFLIDATYGSSTYEAIDPERIYYVYRTQTGIITRSAQRTAPAAAGAPRVVPTRDCAARRPGWERAAAWTDDAVRGALARLGL